MRFQREDAHCLPAWMLNTGVVWSNGWRRRAHRRSDSSIAVRITPSSPASLPALLPSYRPTCSNTPCWQPRCSVTGCRRAFASTARTCCGQGTRAHLCARSSTCYPGNEAGHEQQSISVGTVLLSRELRLAVDYQPGLGNEGPSRRRAHLEGSWPRCPDFIHVGRLGRECIQRQRQSRRRCTAGL